MPLFWLLFAPAAVYQLLANVAAIRHLLRRRRNRRLPATSFQPGVSVLKPIRGLDPNTFEAFVSQACQDYPHFELLFGVADPDDPAIPEIRRLQAAFPTVPIRLEICPEPAPNGKVALLIALARHARYPVWVVNDSDIKVTPSYLSEIVAPLADPSIGVVTCPYRALAHTPAAAWESLGIATDFIPSTLVAQLLGVREFGLGSTLAFRAADLERAGGFAVLAPYIADDYQLAKHITALGKRALLSTYTVETSLGDATWLGVWRHQLRWARTIRLSKGPAYAGLPFSQAGLWLLLALVLHAWVPAAVLVSLRLASAFLTGRLILRSRVTALFFWLAPAWDLYSFCVWLASYAGRGVRWRDRLLRLGPDGRIQQ